MFSTLTADRSALPKSFSPRETESEVNDVDIKRRRMDSTDDHRRHRQQQQQQASRPASRSTSNDVVVDAPAVRILTRRYPLTRTGYKYLAIGLTIEPPSYVDIVLGDHRGKEISLSPDTWRELVKRKPDILSSIRSNVADAPRPPAPLSLGDLTLRFGWINNLQILRMELADGGRLAMSIDTLHSLYDHRFCVDRIVSGLSAITKEVDAKYSRYREIAANATEMGTSPKTAILMSESFNPENIVDCEIVALCFQS